MPSVYVARTLRPPHLCRYVLPSDLRTLGSPLGAHVSVSQRGLAALLRRLCSDAVSPVGRGGRWRGSQSSAGARREHTAGPLCQLMFLLTSHAGPKVQPNRSISCFPGVASLPLHLPEAARGARGTARAFLHFSPCSRPSEAASPAGVPDGPSPPPPGR